MRKRSSKSLARWLRHSYLTLAGGRWTAQLTARVRRALRWLVLNGFLGAASDSIVGSYQSVYFLALGATRTEIGLLGSLTSLTLPLAMLPGGWAASRGRQYRHVLSLLSYLSRLLLLGLVFLPFFSSGIRLIYWGIGIVVLRSFLGNLVIPAHTALIGRVVPPEWRGRYFSTRNILMSAVGLIVLLVTGGLIDRLAAPLGYQIVFSLASVLGVGATYALTRVKDPLRQAAAQAHFNLRIFLEPIRSRSFLSYCLTAALWSLAVQIAAPFFMVFLVEEVRASATVVGTVTAMATLAGLPAQRIFGVLSDRRGARWVQRLTGFIIPLMPGLWSFITQPWQAFPLQMVNTFAWAGYNLASFNLILEMTPEKTRPTFVAVYQIFSGLGMAAGAVLGGWLAQTAGYRAVFLLSSAGRLLTAVLFAVVITHARIFQLSQWRINKPLLKRKDRELENDD